MDSWIQQFISYLDQLCRNVINAFQFIFIKLLNSNLKLKRTGVLPYFLHLFEILWKSARKSSPTSSQCLLLKWMYTSVGLQVLYILVLSACFKLTNTVFQAFPLFFLKCLKENAVNIYQHAEVNFFLRFWKFC